MVVGDLLASVGFNRVQEAAVLIPGTDEADPVQGRVVGSVLVGLHLRKQSTVPRSGTSSGQTCSLSPSSSRYLITEKQQPHLKERFMGHFSQ